MVVVVELELEAIHEQEVIVPEPAPPALSLVMDHRLVIAPCPAIAQRVSP